MKLTELKNVVKQVCEEEENLPPCCICNKHIKTECEVFCLLCCNSLATVRPVTEIPNFDLSVCKSCMKKKSYKEYLKETKVRHNLFYHTAIDFL